MKTLILIAALCASRVWSFTFYDPPAQRPHAIGYHCDDPLLKAVFLAQFEKWNNACSGYFTLQEGQDVAIVYGKVNGLNGAFDGNHIYISPVLAGQGITTETVMIHEIGHFLGLNHSLDQASVMFASNEFSILSQDDITGIRTLYNLPPIDLTSMQFKSFGAGRNQLFVSTGYRLDWDFGDGSAPVLSSSRVRHRYAAGGAYTVTGSYLGFKLPQTIFIKGFKTRRPVSPAG